jgi:hypothetical protein
MLFGEEDQPQEHLQQESCQHWFPSHGEPLQPLSIIDDWGGGGGGAEVLRFYVG